MIDKSARPGFRRALSVAVYVSTLYWTVSLHPPAIMFVLVIAVATALFVLSWNAA
jgi:hypothetical protein